MFVSVILPLPRLNYFFPLVTTAIYLCSFFLTVFVDFYIPGDSGQTTARSILGPYNSNSASAPMVVS